MSVAPLIGAAVETPAGADPATAIDGSTAINVAAATVAIRAPRPIDENKPFRENISTSSVVARPDRPLVANL
jgi:hypothetical protein